MWTIWERCCNIQGQQCTVKVSYSINARKRWQIINAYFWCILIIYMFYHVIRFIEIQLCQYLNISYLNYYNYYLKTPTTFTSTATSWVSILVRSFQRSLFRVTKLSYYLSKPWNPIYQLMCIFKLLLGIGLVGRSVCQSIKRILTTSKHTLEADFLHAFCFNLRYIERKNWKYFWVVFQIAM